MLLSSSVHFWVYIILSPPQRAWGTAYLCDIKLMKSEKMIFRIFKLNGKGAWCTALEKCLKEVNEAKLKCDGYCSMEAFQITPVGDRKSGSGL